MAYLAPRATGAAIAAFLALLPMVGGGLHARPADQAARGADVAPPAISGSSALAARPADLTSVPAGPLALAPDSPAGTDSPAGEEDSTRAVFWAWDFHQSFYYVVRADLVYEGDSALVYVEHGADVPAGSVKGLGALFDEAVYPRVRQSYGSEPNPGIDGQAAVTILLLDIRDPLYYDAAPHTYYSGYFDPVNQRRQSDLDPELPDYRSNEREMIYLDIAPTVAGDVVSRQTMAHEFAHLVLWFHDEHEEEWLVEGLSELAVWLSGLGHPREHVDGFLASPDLSLTSWVGDIRDYGKVYLFMLYTHEQASSRDPDWLRQLVAHPGDGLTSVHDVLPFDRPLAQLLRDFVVAVYRDVPTADGDRLGFASLELADRPSGDEFGRPVLAARDVGGHDRFDLELAPWSWKGMAFASTDDVLDLELVPDDVVCVGWATNGTREIPRTRCLAPGEPVAWPVPRSGSKTETLQVFLANGLPLGNRMSVAAVPPVSSQSAPSRLFVPIAAQH